jgi:hypothetical protein
VQRIDKEEGLLAALKDAMKREHLDDLNRVKHVLPFSKSTASLNYFFMPGLL